MGKNQTYKAMQRARMSSSTSRGTEESEDGLMDGSFHTPEWHAARLASLQTSHTITWEEYKRRQKEEARKKEELDDIEVRMMKEYRAQLDAERASKLARGTNHADKRSESKGKREKDKKRKKSEKKRGHKYESDSSSELSSDDEKSSAMKKAKHKSKKGKKEKRHKSRRKSSSSSNEDSNDEEPEHGPVPLSSFFCNPASQ